MRLATAIISYVPSMESKYGMYEQFFNEHSNVMLTIPACKMIFFECSVARVAVTAEHRQIFFEKMCLA